MSSNILDILIQISFVSAVSFLVYVMLNELSLFNKELQEAKSKSEAGSLAEFYLGMPGDRFFVLRILVATFLFVIFLLISNFVLAMLFSCLGYFSPLLLLKRLKNKRIRKVESQLVEGLELLGNGLKSGLTLQQSIELLIKEFSPPISQEFSLVLAEARLGVDFTEALERMARRLDSSVLYILSSGVGITKQCGGDLTQIFSNIAGTIREQANIEGKLDAVTAQGRFQGLILGLMPFALMIVLYFIDPSHIETLFSYRMGQWAVGGVVLMVLFAQLWIRKLLALDV